MAIAPKHPVPTSRWRHNGGKPEEGYRHFPYYGTGVRDEQMLEMTAGDDFVRKFVRQLANIDSGGKTTRPFDAYHTLDTASVGFAHDTYPSFFEDLSEFIRKSPENRKIAVHAWGEDGAELLSDPKGMVSIMPRRTNDTAPSRLIDNPKYPKPNFKRWDFPDWWDSEKWDFFVAGWHEIARHPKVVEWYTHESLGKLRWGVAKAREYGFKKASSAAALARHANSYGKTGSGKRIAKAVAEVGWPENANEDQVLHQLYLKHYHKNGELGRLKEIKDRFGSGPIPTDISAKRLDYSVKPRHVDGSVPAFVTSGLGDGSVAFRTGGTSKGGGGGGIFLAILSLVGGVLWWRKKR